MTAGAGSSPPRRVLDAWVNPNVPAVADVWRTQQHPHDVASRLFGAEGHIGEGRPISETLGEMDAAGVSAGLLTSMKEFSPFSDVMQFHELVAEIVAGNPERFIAAGGVDPSQGVMPAVRMARRLVDELGFRAVRVMPSMVGAPPNDPMYYPLYAACDELGVPVTINVGLPGPRVPGEYQRPLHVEAVCAAFPELTVVMTHLGWPWHLEVIGLLLKYENLYLMTSAWAPRHYPVELVEYMRTRGTGRVMFATDYPLLSFARCVQEAANLQLPTAAAEAFFHGTAEKVFRW
ncbi:MAG: amidohydrolase family protein [Acidimicrobiia bacterium]